jgi:GNAT superfamily N-acetyltransferase
MSTEEVSVTWRSNVTDDEVDDLHARAFDHPPAGNHWNAQLQTHSLGWVSAREHTWLCGFANVAWDGRDHAFLVDVVVAPDHQGRGTGQKLVRAAVEGARQSGCQWLHVDFEEALEHFYIDRCGFRTSKAGVIPLTQ